MSEQRDAVARTWLTALIIGWFVLNVFFALDTRSKDSQLRDLQRRVGQLEEQVKR